MFADQGQTAQPEPKIEDFMEMMDRELSRTHVGKSFERQQVSTAAAANDANVAKVRSEIEG